MTRPRIVLALVSLGFALAIGCFQHRAQTRFPSNAASLQVAEGLIQKKGAPYSGKVIAHGAEIFVFSELVFATTEGPRPEAPEKFSGFILVAKARDGLFEGKAELHADLRVESVHKQFKSSDDRFALSLAKEFAPTVKIAEANFVGGKLQGVVSLWGTREGSHSLSKVAELSFVDNRLDGEAREWYRGSEQLRQTRVFKAGKLEGPYRRYYRDGALAFESAFVDGRLSGDSRSFYANGQLHEERKTEGRGEGTIVAFFPNGDKQREARISSLSHDEQEWYSNGQLARKRDASGETLYSATGAIETYYASGARKTRSEYADDGSGLLHGSEMLYYENGQAWEQTRYERGRKHGKHEKWWKSGKLALKETYKEGQLEGARQRFYADGTPWEEASYRAGKLDGAFKKWWKNGKLAHDYRYVEGKLDGSYRTYYDNGAKWAVGEYSQGKPRGVLRRWFPDGRLGYVLEHDERGRPHGPWQRWWADGSKRLETQYVDGRLHGEFKNWLEDGEVYELAVFDRGRKVQTTRPQASAAATPR